MISKEIIETCKWALNRSLAIFLSFDAKFYDDYIKDEIDVNLKTTLNIMKKSYSVESLINEEDFSKHPALQEQRMERLRKQNELQAGGKIGKISRSE